MKRHIVGPGGLSIAVGGKRTDQEEEEEGRRMMEKLPFKLCHACKCFILPLRGAPRGESSRPRAGPFSLFFFTTARIKVLTCLNSHGVVVVVVLSLFRHRRVPNREAV